METKPRQIAIMHNGNRQNPIIPGGLYLCQINESVSCGVCCGLYNVADASYDTLHKMLDRRTEQFVQVPRESEAILAFQKEIEQHEKNKRPFQTLHHCAFLGLIGERRSRVGCLLHPMHDGNNGVDFRGLSYYGGMACRIYFCPTHTYLLRWIKEVVHLAVADWYDYGLMISEPHLLGPIFSKVAHRLGREITTTDFKGNEKALQAVQEIAAIKRCWPFRESQKGALVNCFINDRRYQKPSVDYHAIGVAESKYDTIFRELFSRFDTQEDFHRAEAMLNAMIDRIVSSL